MGGVADLLVHCFDEKKKKNLWKTHSLSLLTLSVSRDFHKLPAVLNL